MLYHSFCITHKIRGIEQYFRYADLPPLNAYGQSITTQEGKGQRKFEITEEAYESYQAETIEQAKDRQFKSEVQQWESVEPEAVRLFLRDIDLTLTFYQFSPELYLHIQTTHHLERMFREFRTKSDEIGTFPNEKSCLTVFFLVIERDHAKHNRKSMAKTSGH